MGNRAGADGTAALRRPLKSTENIRGRQGPARPLSAPSGSGLALAAERFFLAFLPAVLLIGLVIDRYLIGKYLGFDYKPLWEASRHIFHGASPYPPPHAWALHDEQQFVYPPIAALLAAPLAVFPFTVAAVLLAFLDVFATGLTLRVLGVRDWRCYGLTFLWYPVIQNVLVARRGLAAMRALGVALAGIALSWALIGFAGLTSYPRLLDVLSRLEQWKSYSAVALGLVLGLSTGEARALAIIAGTVVLLGVVLVGRIRKEDPDADRHAFVLALAAAFLFSPIVWTHYLALLVVPIAITRRTLTPLWFVPLAMWLTPGQSDGQTWRVLLGFSVWVVVLAASWRPAPPIPAFRRRPEPLPTS